jgi:hypothetical protein
MEYQALPPMMPESVVLTDWAADLEHLGKGPEAVLYELMLLSLLYDSILIQDEVFALSDKVSWWFSSSGYAELLPECFDLGAMVVLTHPLLVYPTDDLRELALDSPILARAKYVEKYGTRAEYRFVPTERQKAFYHLVDSYLQVRPAAHRPVGSLQKLDIMSCFATVLRDVLSMRQYTKWRDSAFPGITDAMAEDFVGYIDEPDKLAAKLKDSGRDYVVLTEPEGRPVFNRSLGYQAASLYPRNQARAMQRLIQTTFAAPFTWRENAAGRYSKSLRELLWMPTDSLAEVGEIESEEDIVSVEAHIDTPIVLPDLDSDFVDAIARVRTSAAGKKLRWSMRRFGEEIDFESQKQAWSEVADELAAAVTRPRPVCIRTALLRVGKSAVIGSVAKGLFDAVRGEDPHIGLGLAGAFLCGAAGLAFNHGLELFRYDLQRQRIRSQIEQAVEFRCVSLAMPPLPHG